MDLSDTRGQPLTDIKERLATVLSGLSKGASTDPDADLGTSLRTACARSRVREMTAQLSKESVPHTEALDIFDWAAVKHKAADLMCLPPAGFDDVERTPLHPFSLSAPSSTQPSPIFASRAGGPMLGTHTEDVLRRGWLGPSELRPLPAAEGSVAGSNEGPLSGVTIVELTVDYGLGAAAAAAQLQSSGATVIQV